MLQLSPAAAEAAIDVKNGKVDENITAQKANANFRLVSINPSRNISHILRHSRNRSKR
jgi:hypothetical protein